jgi:hypothetical protein
MPNHRDSEERAASLARFFAERAAEVGSFRSEERGSAFEIRRYEQGIFSRISPKVDVYTADVVNLTERFSRSLILTNAMFAGEFPVVIGPEGPIPIDMSSVLGRGPFDVRRLEFELDTRSFIDFPWAHRAPFSRMRLENLAVDEALSVFQRHLFGFLYTRFEARESDISEKPGRLFTVTTDTEGLRVHYSTAFIFEPDHVFGEPTNPVRGWLQPGNYHFGAMGSGVELWFDMKGKYDVPRQDKAHLRI